MAADGKQKTRVRSRSPPKKETGEKQTSTEAGEKPKDTDKKPEPSEEGKKQPLGKANGAESKNGEQPGPGQDELDAVVQMMQSQEFDKASQKLAQMLRKYPDDPVLLHNLGVICTEQERYAEAEEIFMKAFDSQEKTGKYNYATLFGLATVLTEQGGMGKLMQAEALFRDCLMQAIKEEEKGIFETYRTFTSLAENLGLQKRWKDASEAYEQAHDLGSRMFGEEHDRTKANKAMMIRAKKLAKMQKYMRGALWTFTAAVPVVCAWMWRYSGAPSLGEIFFWSSGQNVTELAEAVGLR